MQQISIGFDDLLLISPLLILFVSSLVPLTVKVLNGNREPNEFFTRVASLLGVVAPLIMILALQVDETRTAFMNSLVFDGISYWVGLLIMISTCVSLFLVFEHVAMRGSQLCEQIFLIMNAAAGMLILLWANDLIVTFIGIEIMSLALYLLIAMSREGHLAKEAAFKYFILGSFASAILLYGISFVYGVAGTTYLDQLANISSRLIEVNTLFLIGMVLVVAGFAFKVSVFPFHTWAPDVYQGSPTPVTAFMATAVKLVTFTAFLRVILTKSLLGSEALVTALQWLAVLTMIAGNVTALLQENLKRMLAYSSISHSGYALIGLIAAGVSAKGLEGASGLIFYLFTYTIMTLGSFALVCLFEKFEDTSVAIKDLKGLANERPMMALMLTVLLISLAGLPPTLGFFGKFYLFSAAINEGLIWLACWGMISSVVGVYYYLRPVVYMFMHEDKPAQVVGSRTLTHLTVVVSSLAILLIGLYSSPFFGSVKASVASLF